MTDSTSPTLQSLSPEECVEFLASARVGRIALSVDALPTVLPVNYVLYGDDIVFRTAPGAKLNAATSRTVVAFEVDGFEPDGASGWSVIAQGVASEVTDVGELAEIAVLLGEPWPGAGPDVRVVRVSVNKLSGRRFDRHEVEEAQGWWIAFLNEGYL